MLKKSKNYTYYYAIFISMALMFGGGFTTTFKSTFTPYLQDFLNLNYVGIQSMQFSFYMGYFILSPLTGLLLNYLKFEKTIPIGFGAVALGCFIALFAAQLKLFALFICALFAIGSGIALLQVAGNLYVVLIGDSSTALSRLTFLQAFTSIGMSIAPAFASIFMFDSALGSEIADSVYIPSIQKPFLLLSVVWLVFFLLTLRFPLPPASSGVSKVLPSGDIWKNKGVLISALGICIYVGVEVCTANFAVRFLQLPNIGNLPMHTAAQATTLYWTGILAGRLAGARLFRGKNEKDILIIHSLLGAFFTAIAILSSGSLAIAAVLSLGLWNSILFPVIYSLGIKCAPGGESQASGILCMANIGGAILPMFQAMVADNFAVQISFIIPLMGYLLIAGCAIKAGKFKRSKPACA